MSSVVINSFTDEYAFLSNSYSHPIEYNGLTYSNAEATFWAQKVKDVNARKKYTRLSGQKARAKSSQAESVQDWEEIQDDIMREILKIKFSDAKLMKQLKETKPRKLINTTNIRDTYWGFSDGKGANRLGQLLEEIRDQ